MRDLQIIGDRIEFMGYHVGNLLDMPPSLRHAFQTKLDKAATDITSPIDEAEEAHIQ